MPEYHFLDATLQQWRDQPSALSLLCARCFVRSSHFEDERNIKKATFTCCACETKKPILDGGPVTVKDWMQQKRNQLRWRCYECQYPPCHQCGNRPLHAISHDSLVDGKYYCEECRYPSCSALVDGQPCGNKRRNPGSNHRFQPYTCPTCIGAAKSAKAEGHQCNVCKKVFAPSDLVSKANNFVCNACTEEMFPCESCGASLRRECFVAAHIGDFKNPKSTRRTLECVSCRSL